MAEVRCPKCDQLNPAESDTCRYCGAELTSPKTDSPPPTSKGGLFGWLRGQKKDSGRQDESSPQPPEGVPPSPSGPQDETPVPDWLAELRKRNLEEEGSTGLDLTNGAIEGAGEEPAQESLDWLREVKPGEKRVIPPGETSDWESVNAWLSSLRTEDENQLQTDDTIPSSTSSSRQPTTPSMEDMDEETASWMQDLMNWQPSGIKYDDIEAQEFSLPPDSAVPSQAESLPEPVQQTPEEEPAQFERLEKQFGEEEVPLDEAGLPSSEIERPVESLPADQPVSAFEQPSQVEELPSWFTELEAEAVSSGEAGVPVEQESLPDWLGPVSEQLPSAEAPAEMETPAWLRALQENLVAQPEETPSSEQKPISEPPETPEKVEELPEWLKEQRGQQQPSVQAAQPEEPLPEWLAGEVPQQPKSETESKPESELPDWLKGAAIPPSTTEIAPEAESEIPAWLKGEVTIPASPEGAPAEAELPDWLKTESAEQAPSESIPFESELPDWLSALGETPPELVELPGDLQAAQGQEAPFEPLTAASESVAQESEPTTEVPQGTGENVPQVVGEEELNQPEEPGSPPAFVLEESELPDWLGEEAIPSTTPVEEGVTAVSPFAGTDLPDWLAEETISPPAESAEVPATPAFIEGQTIESEPPALPVHPFEESELPDWLEEEAAPEETAPAQAETSELTPAQLPSWVESMRPVEAVELGGAIRVDDTRTEQAGPLAGLPGILPAEELAWRSRKPPIYSIKLRISEKQKERAKILENAIAVETQAQEVRAEPTQAPQRLVRMVVGLVLIAVLLVSSMFPASAPQVVTDQYLIHSFYNQVEALHEGSLVLLAVDFEAGYAGEMRMAAQAVIERLMSKNIPLVLVSTVPAGPVMAENLLQKAHQNNPGYSLDDRVINLGYLAGGITSLQELARAPFEAARYDFHRKSSLTPDAAQIAWTLPVLSGTSDLTRFAMVIVLSDSVDTGRAWIEQVQPVLESTPMLLVTSAQSSPVLQSYAYSGQAKGLLSGLAGGTAYRQLVQQPGSSLYEYSAYRAGLWLAVILVLIGIVYRGIERIFSRRKV